MKIKRNYLKNINYETNMYRFILDLKLSFGLDIFKLEKNKFKEEASSF